MRGEEARAYESGAPACAEARELLARFVRKSLGRDEDRRLRAHLLACGECKEEYRTKVASAANLGRALRESRLERLRDARRTDNRQRAMSAATRPPGSRRRYFGLRLALIPALLIVLLMKLPGLVATEPLTLLWQAGDVRAAGSVLGAQSPTLELEAGVWCTTAGDSRARLEGPHQELELGHDTQLVVEDPEAGRVRLQLGSLVLEGRGTVTSQFGVLETRSGKARLELLGGRFALIAVAGDVSWTDASGRRSLAPGERLGSL